MEDVLVVRTCCLVLARPGGGGASFVRFFLGRDRDFGRDGAEEWFV